MVYLC